MIYLVQPDSGSTVSGGFRFNHEMARRLEARGAGRALGLDELAATGLLANGSGDTAVVDSLFLRAPVPSWLHRFDGSRVLLLHYLPSFQPHLDEAASRSFREHENDWFDWAERIVAPSYRFTARLRRRVPAHLELHVATPAVGAAFRKPRERQRAIEKAEGWIAGPPEKAEGWIAGPPEKAEGWISRPLSERRRVRIVTLSALTEGKNVAAILASLASRPAGSFSWDIAGDLDREPGYRRRFMAEVQRSGLSGSVRLWHCLDQAEVAQLLDRSHLYVTASREESFGMATAEAAARGLPVVSYDVGCASKWVTPDVNGLLFPLTQASEFARELGALVDDRPRLNRLRESAGALSQRLRFASWDDTFREFRLALGTSLGRRPLAQTASSVSAARGRGARL